MYESIAAATVKKVWWVSDKTPNLCSVLLRGKLQAKSQIWLCGKSILNWYQIRYVSYKWRWQTLPKFNINNMPKETATNNPPVIQRPPQEIKTGK